MRRALEIARRGRGRVEPNPMVGCVIVRGGRIIGQGYHHRFGGPHAEVEAIRAARGNVRGATFYVTLEPCCYHGKTPPCTAALIAAGAARVVAAMRDPNPRVAGKGLRALRAAGIRAEVGLLEEEAAALNAPFIKLMRKKRPWVIAKWAQSLDGKIATRTGDSKWISDATARRHAHATRGRVDAIVVGVNTVLADDPQLTCRDAPLRRVAARVVLDSHLRIPLTAGLVKTAHQIPTWIFHAAAAPPRKITSLLRAGCILKGVPASGRGLKPDSVLKKLAAAGMANVLIEGGGSVLGHWLDAGAIDEIQVYVAPVLIGGRQAVSALAGVGPRLVTNAVRLPADPEFVRLGDGWFLNCRLHD